MKYINRLSPAILLYVVLATCNSDATDNIKLLPNDLLKVASNHQCKQINDFYDRPGMLNPAYAYGYSSDILKESAVFWCEKIENSNKTYHLIVFHSKIHNELSKCPDDIPWQNFPGGLSIVKGNNATLDGFRYVLDPHKQVNERTNMKHNAILSEYDGVEELFYCHDGAWLVRQRD